MRSDFPSSVPIPSVRHFLRNRLEARVLVCVKEAPTGGRSKKRESGVEREDLRDWTFVVRPDYH